MAACTRLARALADRKVSLYVVGDSAGVGRIMQAVETGARAGAEV